jgi:uncharacterized protein
MHAAESMGWIMKRISRRGFLGALLAGLLVVVALPAAAQDLQEAKRAGWVGEQRDGYLGLVDPGAPPAVRQLIQQVNAERRRNYTAIAAKNGTELNKVELLAAEKAMQRTAAGHFIQGPDGSWVRR